VETTPRITELRVAADPAAWREAGFTVEAGVARIGATVVRLEGTDAGRGLIGWRLAGVEDDQWDGLPTELAPALAVVSGRDSAGARHPIGALRIDHLVVFTPERERTIDAFETNGVRCRRVREVGPPDQQLRQAFFRFGEMIVEVVQVPADQAGPEGAALLWGLTVTVADLDGAAADLGPERIGTIRDAVQPGRRIATLKREAGLGLPVALITPEKRARRPG
jgi:hypothetical protein